MGEKEYHVGDEFELRGERLAGFTDDVHWQMGTPHLRLERNTRVNTGHTLRLRWITVCAEGMGAFFKDGSLSSAA